MKDLTQCESCGWWIFESDKIVNDKNKVLCVQCSKGGDNNESKDNPDGSKNK